MRRAWLSIPLLLSIVALASSAQAKRIEAAARPANSARAVANQSATPKAGAGKAPAKPAAAKASAKKKVAPGVAKLAKQAQGKRPCLARPVQLVRVRGEQVEPHELSLTKCNATPNLAVLDELSVIARPRDVDRPSAAELKAYRARPIAKGKLPKKSKQKFRNPAFVSERIMRVNPGLLVRLQQVANHYPGKIIEVISGYRPDARDTSRHHHGRALDLRVAGVAREKLVDYLRGLDDTGVGYYPNSYFVHMDVRDQKAYWVDRSGPGEPADYGPWPLTPTQPRLDRERDDIVKGALAALVELDQPLFHEQDQRSAKVTQPLRSKARVREPEQEADDMSADEVRRVRAEARSALQQL